METKGINMLSKEQKDYIVHCIEKNIELPEDFKYMLFPTVQKEYELTYAGKMRKEDILANEDGVFPVPLQLEKIFNGNQHKAFEDEWRNMIVFGDNLQFLKTIYENKDPIVKDKIKGKIKLIYIDPPFATTDEFKNKEGAKAYNDKKKGAEFVEFLRKRLIVAREILADDGSIFVHCDWRMSAYIKIIMDEVFGKNKFVNEISICYSGPSNQKKNFPRKHDNIYYYRKGNYGTFNIESTRISYKKTNLSTGKTSLAGRADDSYLKKLDKQGKQIEDYWTDIRTGSHIPKIIRSSAENYPTLKDEKLLERIISATTQEGDLVLDFFGGSGTTATASEKLRRKWITCDIGKLSFFTTQKRIVKIANSISYTNPKKQYNKNAKTFMTCTLGIYDLKKALDLEWDKYCNFVSGLFELNLKKHKISGYTFEGKKNSYSVKIWDYNKFKNSSVDENYLNSIHQSIGSKASGRVYIVAPANNIDFLTDYHEVDGLRYYFLKIPYQVIRDLHKIPFQKLRQPQSIKNVNDLDETIGFHFIKQPEVKAKIKTTQNEIIISIKEFKSQYYRDEAGKVLENFETLSAVFVDSCFNGEQFIMTHSFFADELLPKKKTKNGDTTEIRNELVQLKNNSLHIAIKKTEADKKIMVVYTDIYGNDFTEIFNIIEG